MEELRLLLDLPKGEFRELKYGNSIKTNSWKSANIETAREMFFGILGNVFGATVNTDFRKIVTPPVIIEQKKQLPQSLLTRN